MILEGLFTGRSGRIEALGSYTDMSLTAARKAQSPQMFAQPDATNDGQYTNGYAISNKNGLLPPFGGLTLSRLLGTLRLCDNHRGNNKTKISTTVIYLHLRENRKRERVNAAEQASGIFM